MSRADWIFVGIVVLTLLGWLVAVPALGYWARLTTRNRRIRRDREAQATRTKGVVPPVDDLTAVADAVAEPVARCEMSWPGDGEHHRCVRPRPGHDVHLCACMAMWPEVERVPTLREERIDMGPGPDPAVLGLRVLVGNREVCLICRDARTAGRWGGICRECRPILVGPASEYPAGAA